MRIKFASDMDCRNTRPVQFGDLPGDALEFGKIDRRAVAEVDVAGGSWDREMTWFAVSVEPEVIDSVQSTP